MTPGTGFIFRASWPILNDRMTLSQLKAEGAEKIAQVAYETDAEIVGDITWTLNAKGNRLIAQSAGQPAAKRGRTRARWGSVQTRIPVINAMHAAGKTDAQIAAKLGCRPDSIKHARLRAKQRAAA